MERIDYSRAYRDDCDTADSYDCFDYMTEPSARRRNRLAEKEIKSSRKLLKDMELIDVSLELIRQQLKSKAYADSYDSLREERLRLRNLRRQLNARYQRFERIWKQLTERERDVLNELCFCEYSEKLYARLKLAERLGYSERTIIRMRDNALGHYMAVARYLR